MHLRKATLSKFYFSKIKTATSTSLAIALLVTTTPSATATETYPTTVSFLAKSFVAGKAIEGATPGSFEYGFTLDAMMQLKAGGRSLVQQLPAVNFMLATRSQPMGTASSGYLFNQDAEKSVNVGRAGKFLFTSQVINVPNNSIRYEIFKRLAARINSQTGEISGIASGSIDYAWVALGLNSYQEFTLANKDYFDLLLNDVHGMTINNEINVENLKSLIDTLFPYTTLFRSRKSVV